MEETTSGGGVVVNNDKVLVINQNGNSWSLPKGHIDPGEDAQAAAVREIQEESGITQLEFIKQLGTYQRYRIGKNGDGEDKTNLKTIIMFLYTTTEVNLKPTDPHNPEARWVGPDEVVALLTHPKDKAFFQQIIGEVKECIKNNRESD